MNYKYTLEKYTDKSSRYTCPACGKAHRFTRYIDTETGEHLRHDVGRCNREVKCGYHYKPKQYFEDNPVQVPNDKFQYPTTNNTRVIAKSATMKQSHETQPALRETASCLAVTGGMSDRQGRQGVSLHTLTELTDTLCDYPNNHLLQYLATKLGATAVQALADKYQVGTHHHWQGATVYWYLDKDQHICKGKLMLYNPVTGKRVKEPFPHITWMHTVLGKQDFSSRHCFFGEHLLTNYRQSVCIVESEKTAMIAAHYLPDSIWLATGGIASLKADYCQRVLQGRKITLFPDAGGYDKWSAIAQQLDSCRISPIVEQYHISDSDDIADLLLCA